MTDMNEPKKGVDFTDLTIELEERTLDLCNETYAAIKKPPATPKLEELIARAEAHIAHFDSLLQQYDGGRKAAIESAGQQVKPLRNFITQLKDKLKGAG